MALHLVTSPSGRLPLKGTLTCFTLRSFVRLIILWEVVVRKCLRHCSALLQPPSCCITHVSPWAGHLYLTCRGREAGELPGMELGLVCVWIEV